MPLPTRQQTITVVDREQIRKDLVEIIGYTCEISLPNAEPIETYFTDRWMTPRLDALVEYVVQAAE